MLFNLIECNTHCSALKKRGESFNTWLFYCKITPQIMKYLSLICIVHILLTFSIPTSGFVIKHKFTYLKIIII